MYVWLLSYAHIVIRLFNFLDSYKEDLLEVIGADVLPAFLGGNRTDPDGNPMCHTIVSKI